MSNIKISQLPEYTGNTSGSWLVMNDSGETTTYKVERENMLSGMATTGSNVFNGNQTITGSLTVSGSLEVTGSIRTNGVISVKRNGIGLYLESLNTSQSLDAFALNNSVELSLSSKSLDPLNPKYSAFRLSNENTSGEFNVEFIKESGSFFLRGNQVPDVPPATNRDIFRVKDTLSGSAVRFPVEFKRNVEVTGSLNVSSGSMNLSVKETSGKFSFLTLENNLTSSAIISSGSIVAYLTCRSTDNDQVVLSARSGSGIVLNDTSNGVAQTIFSIKTNTSGSFPPVEFKRNVEVTGSVNITNKLNLASQNPLPAGVLGDLAVSSSNALYFHNGTSWNLIS